MADTVSEKLEQKELWGAAATIARAAGGHVIPLHRNITNPRNQSDPDLLVLHPVVPMTFIKCFITPALSRPQRAVRDAIEATGVPYLIFTPADLESLAHYFGDGRGIAAFSVKASEL